MKPILAFYVDVTNMPASAVGKYIKDMTSKMKGNKDEATRYFIPVRGENSRVECIYPKFLVVNGEMKDELENLQQSIQHLTDSLSNTIKKES